MKRVSIALFLLRFCALFAPDDVRGIDGWELLESDSAQDPEITWVDLNQWSSVTWEHGDGFSTRKTVNYIGDIGDLTNKLITSEEELKFPHLDKKPEVAEELEKALWKLKRRFERFCQLYVPASNELGHLELFTCLCRLEIEELCGIEKGKMNVLRENVLLSKIISKHLIKGGKVPRKIGKSSDELNSEGRFPDTEAEEIEIFKKFFPEFKHIF